MFPDGSELEPQRQQPRKRMVDMLHIQRQREEVMFHSQNQIVLVDGFFR